VELTVIKVLPDGSEKERTVRINPDMPTPAGATSVHGITDEDVASQTPFSRYAKDFTAVLDRSDLAGFNAIRFDLPILRAQFARAGVRFEMEGRNAVDPMAIFHQMEPWDLDAAYRRYRGKAMDDVHTSLADVGTAM
jgi:DNA polymerase-3 subunit epsilon